MPRPSGTRQTPSRASSSGRAPPARRARGPRPCRAVGAIWPLATFSVVDLPAPFGPSSANTWPGGHDEVDAVQHVDRAVAGAHVAQLERAGGAPSARRRRPSAVASLAQRPRRACGAASADRLLARRRRGTRRAPPRSPAPRSGVPSAMIRPKSSTWMCSQAPITKLMSCSTSSTPSPSAASSRSKRAERGGLGLVETRRRLVEQQHPRLARERAGHLDEPRGAGRERVDALARDALEPDPLEQLVGQRAGVELLARPARAASPPRRARCRARVRVPKVSSRWKVRPMPSRARWCGLASRDVLAVEQRPGPASAPAGR